jgi:hypothetical protein
VEDLLRSQLEERLASAERILTKAVKTLLDAKEGAVEARHDVEAYRAALAALTRNNGTPYIAKPVVTAADSLFAANGYKPTVVSRGRVSSKSEEVRRAIQESPGLRTREVYEKLLEKNLAKPLTMEEIHRVASRLVMRGEAERDESGGLHLTANAKKR